MIEVKNLKKTYVTKGTTTHALDDVSIKFPEKGMVFLLGKSGSGKSTLLNSIGGLDTVDSGEIIIMGRSSSTFSGSDFDSYRNTFIGFIFQEYNILNEFSVEENIALALELQGKKSNKERVHKLLEEVDLKGFEKRKPNTLSGGQKQRIAIARALIKEPKIIMADEPTGALDSKTGKQVLDTLKKLSKEKLIIIVSHDREFAEIYGDRIIELKDGKIISDEQKTHIDPKNLNDNVSIIGENTLSIKDAKSLSAEDKGEILKFIEQANDKIIIATNNNDISSFKKANRISDDDKTETFTKTGDIVLRSYDEKERKFIRSRLPITKATKMGLSSLKVKPFRLVITMLLTIISFTLFGVSSSLMNYNGKKVTKNSFNKSDYNSLKITNNYSYENKYYVNDKLDSTSTNNEQTYFTDEDVNNLYTSYGNDTLALYALNNIHNSSPSISNIETLSTTPKTLQGNQIDGFATPKDGSKYDYYLHGVKPAKNDEIAISDFYAKLILNSKLKDVNNPEQTINVNNEDDLLGKKLRFSFSWDSYKLDYKITGIYRSDDISNKYNNYDNQEEVNKWSSKKIEEFKDYIEETPRKVFFITKEAYKALATYIKFNPKDNDGNYYKYFNQAKSYNITINDSYSLQYSSFKKKSEATLPITYLNGYDENSEGIIIYRNDFINAISSSGISIPFNYDSYDMNEISLKIKDFVYAYYERQLELFYDAFSAGEKETFDNDYLDFYNFQKELTYYKKINDEDKINEIESSDEYASASVKFNDDSSTYYNFFNLINTYDDAEFSVNNGLADFYSDIYIRNFSCGSINYISRHEGYNDDINEAFGIYANYILNADLGYCPVALNEYDSSMTITRKIIGYYEKTNNDDGNHTYGIYVDDNDQEIFRSKYYTSQESKFELKDSDAYYNYAYVPTNNSIFNDLEAVKDNDSFISARNSLYSKINQITELIGMLKDIFFYLGLALAIFSALLLFNFITVSISSKTHEIGVLRAVGARGKDVFKIFFAESLFIALLSFLIALAAAIAIVIILNANLSKQLSFELVLLSFGPLSVALMLGIALAVALVGTFIPVLHISRKKPVDSLRAQ